MKVLGIIVGVLAVLALLWIAGEMHYRNCLTAAEYKPLPPELAAQNCSRLPF